MSWNNVIFVILGIVFGWLLKSLYLQYKEGTKDIDRYFRGQIKDIFIKFSVGFIFLIVTIYILKFSPHILKNVSLDDASLNSIKTFNISLLIINYLRFSSLCVVCFSFMAFVYSRLNRLDYKEGVKNIILVKNIIFLIFIVTFSLTSLTVDQLDILSLMISSVILFKFVFESENKLPEEDVHDKEKEADI